MSIQVKRVYEPAEDADGQRVLVDRVWPRGMKKEAAQLDAWVKEVAPSAELRKWFGHDPGKWEDFKARYFEELDAKPDAVSDLKERAAQGRLTLVYGAKDTAHNNAVALKAYLEQRAGV